MHIKLAVFAAAVLAGATSAQAQMVRAQDPAGVLAAIQKAGLTGSLGTDALGDPQIKSAVNGHPFVVIFYGCTKNKDCATITLESGFDKKKPTRLETINEWNRKNRFGRAYLDSESDPFLAMDIDLDDGGISPALFADNLEFWSAVTNGFQKHIGWDDE